MFRRSDRELLELERELRALEEECEEDECEEDECEDDDCEEEPEQADEDAEEEETCDDERCGRRDIQRYRRGNPKKFADDDFFDEGFDDGDVLFRKDYKKAKRKKRWRTFGLLLLAVLELAAIGAVLLWFISWIQ